MTRPLLFTDQAHAYRSQKDAAADAIAGYADRIAADILAASPSPDAAPLRFTRTSDSTWHLHAEGTPTITVTTDGAHTLTAADLHTITGILNTLGDEFSALTAGNTSTLITIPCTQNGI